MSNTSNNDKQYLLIILSERIAFGPFTTADETEYAAQDYYGTAVTGASIKGEFLIAELRCGSDMVTRQHEAHVRGLMSSDV